MEEIKYKFDEINLRDIEEAPLNAQSMSKEDFNRLVLNLKKDKILTSAVLLMRQSGKTKLMCISGHHRIKAAVKAGIKKTPAIILDELSESTRIRLQLSHNDINGISDKNIVSILQQKLTGDNIVLVKWGERQPINFETKDIKINIFKHVVIAMIPNTFDEFENMINEFDPMADEKYLVSKSEYKDLTSLLTLAFKKGFRSPGQALRKFLDIVAENSEQIKK